jgi:hypothetical protein
LVSRVLPRSETVFTKWRKGCPASVDGAVSGSEDINIPLPDPDSVMFAANFRGSLPGQFPGRNRKMTLNGDKCKAKLSTALLQAGICRARERREIRRPGRFVLTKAHGIASALVAQDNAGGRAP